MKKIIISIICLTVLSVLGSCSSEKYVVSANGDKAEVKLINGKEFVSEIVSIQDTAIIFATTPANPLDFPHLFLEPIAEIKSITIKGYDGSGWGGSVLLFQVLPAALMAGAAASYSEGSGALLVGLVFAIPAAITALLFSGSAGETPQWNDEMSVSEIENLKIYSRYPEGMSQEKLSKLLKKYNQTELKKYF